MFSLGDIYERGDAAPKDVPMAMAWFAITAEFERQANRGAETALAKTALCLCVALPLALHPPMAARWALRGVFHLGGAAGAMATAGGSRRMPRTAFSAPNPAAPRVIAAAIA